jgi:hypothetical protein
MEEREDRCSKKIERDQRKAETCERMSWFRNSWAGAKCGAKGG